MNQPRYEDRPEYHEYTTTEGGPSALVVLLAAIVFAFAVGTGIAILAGAAF